MLFYIAKLLQLGRDAIVFVSIERHKPTHFGTIKYAENLMFTAIQFIIINIIETQFTYVKVTYKKIEFGF